MEKNASPTEEITFLLDKDSFEGVRLYDFQNKALMKLRGLGALTLVSEYRRQTHMMRIINEINEQMVPSFPDGYVVRFSEDKFKSALVRLRHSIASGDIHQEPAFELSLKKLSLIVTDLETGKEYLLHKMQLGSPVQEIFEYVFHRQNFDVEKEELIKARIDIGKGLNKRINPLRLPPLVREIFFNTSQNRLIIYKIVFTSDLKRMGVGIDALRKELIEHDKG